MSPEILPITKDYCCGVKPKLENEPWLDCLQRRKRSSETYAHVIRSDHVPKIDKRTQFGQF
jgi:hypothetical protein